MFIYVIIIFILVAGRKCELHTVEGSAVSGEFKGCDINVEEFFISNLQTPIATIPHAVVRDKDMIEIFFPNITDTQK